MMPREQIEILRKMKKPRQTFNKEIKRLVAQEFSKYKNKQVSISQVSHFKLKQEDLIQDFAHKWIPKKSKGICNHADRYDIKIALRKQLNSDIIDFFITNNITAVRESVWV